MVGIPRKYIEIFRSNGIISFLRMLLAGVIVCNLSF